MGLLQLDQEMALGRKGNLTATCLYPSVSRLARRWSQDLAVQHGEDKRQKACVETKSQTACDRSSSPSKEGREEMEKVAQRGCIGSIPRGFQGPNR